MLKLDIEEIRKAIRAGRFTNEAAVSQGIVLRILQALSWPTYDTQIVSPEYSVEGRRVDFALCHPATKPAAFIEVKKVGLGDEAAERQLFEYAFLKGIPMAILTDGQEWQFFLPAEQGDFGERRVYKLDIVEREIDETVSRLERYLKYEAVCSGSAKAAARADHQNLTQERQTKATLPEAWRKLVEEEDDILLERLAASVEDICGYKPDVDTVASFLHENFQHSLSPDIVSKKDVKPRSPLTIVERPTQDSFTFDGRVHTARNGREVLTKVFGEFADRDPTFLERFASLPKHGRTRRYLARSRDDLFPGRPDLSREFSYELTPGWWLGTNLSRHSIERVLEMACEVAGLSYGTDLKVKLS